MCIFSPLLCQCSVDSDEHIRSWIGLWWPKWIDLGLIRHCAWFKKQKFLDVPPNLQRHILLPVNASFHKNWLNNVGCVADVEKKFVGALKVNDEYSRIRIRGSVRQYEFEDPDPYQNVTDPRHWYSRCPLRYRATILILLQNNVEKGKKLQ